MRGDWQAPSASSRGSANRASLGIMTFFLLFLGGGATQAGHRPIPRSIHPRRGQRLIHWPTIGAVLCETWSFPEPLVSAIRMHNLPGTGRDATPVRKCLFVANLLAARVHQPTNAPPCMDEDDLPPWVFRTFGNDFDSIIDSLSGLKTDLQQATSLLQVGKGAL